MHLVLSPSGTSGALRVSSLSAPGMGNIGHIFVRTFVTTLGSRSKCAVLVARISDLVVERHNLRVASQREPPSPREQDREERIRPAWPNQKPTGGPVPGLKLGRAGATCAELRPVGSNFGSALGQLGSVCLAPMLGPRQARSGQHGLARTFIVTVRKQVFSESH